jgi:hypothetical protein
MVHHQCDKNIHTHFRFRNNSGTGQIIAYVLENLHDEEREHELSLQDGGTIHKVSNSMAT